MSSSRFGSMAGGHADATCLLSIHFRLFVQVIHEVHHAAVVNMHVGKFYMVCLVPCLTVITWYLLLHVLWTWNIRNKLKASKHKTRRCFGTTPARHYEHALDNDIYFLCGCQSRRYTTLDVIHGYIESVIFSLSFSSDSLIWTTDFDDER